LVKYKKYVVSSDEENIRIDRWLRRKFYNIPQSFVQKKLRKGFIKLNDKKIKANKLIKKNDLIKIYQFDESSYAPKKIKTINKANEKDIKKFEKSKIYENNDFIIINKWAGISTQGGTKVTLSIDQIINSISEKYNLVHRLDKQTSGVLIISKNYSTTRFFGKLFKDRKISKTYIALCKGKIKERKKTIELDLNKQKYYKKNSIVANKDKKISLTNYEVLEYKSGISSVVFLPLSGRMHQIRVVAKYLNSPILGDSKYNNARENNKSELMLHSSAINFLYKNKKQFFVAEIPEKMKNNFKKYGLKIPKNKFIEQYN